MIILMISPGGICGSNYAWAWTQKVNNQLEAFDGFRIGQRKAGIVEIILENKKYNQTPVQSPNSNNYGYFLNICSKYNTSSYSLKIDF